MAGVCDFVFLIDATGSMAPCIDALKSNIGVFIDGLAGGQSPVREWRGRVIAYRDVLADGKSWWEEYPFVRNDAAALRAQLAKVTPGGGGDEPESLLDALYSLSKLGSTAKGQADLDPNKWRHRSEAARVIIVFTDASYHPTMSIPGAAGGGLTDVTYAAMSEKLIIILYAPDLTCYGEMAAIDKCEWEPIAGPDFVEGLAKYTKDTANFQKALLALAKSVSKSAEVPIL